MKRVSTTRFQTEGQIWKLSRTTGLRKNGQDKAEINQQFKMKSYSKWPATNYWNAKTNAHTKKHFPWNAWILPWIGRKCIVPGWWRNELRMQRRWRSLRCASGGVAVVTGATVKLLSGSRCSFTFSLVANGRAVPSERQPEQPRHVSSSSFAPSGRKSNR